MLIGFTPPAVKREPPKAKPTVKREPGSTLTGFTPAKRETQAKPVIKREPMGPDTPWVMQTVTVQPEPTEPPRLLRVEPVHPPKQRVPWETQPTPPPEAPEQPPLREVRPRPPGHAPPAWDERPREPPDSGQTSSSAQAPTAPSALRHVCAKNYAAIEAGLERFGLIDEGPQNAGRALLIHVRKRCRPPFLLLNAVRPGTVLHVSRQGKTATLRVRSTTPARYYSPGSQVTTLSLLVDEADWRSLTTSASRI